MILMGPFQLWLFCESGALYLLSKSLWHSAVVDMDTFHQNHKCCHTVSLGMEGTSASLSLDQQVGFGSKLLRDNGAECRLCSTRQICSQASPPAMYPADFRQGAK